ncbi:unnamed protein product, partial [Urochloa humidicola]
MHDMKTQLPKDVLRIHQILDLQLMDLCKKQLCVDQNNVYMCDDVSPCCFPFYFASDFDFFCPDLCLGLLDLFLMPIVSAANQGLLLVYTDHICCIDFFYFIMGQLFY